MKLSTANWSAAFLSILGVSTIGLFFYIRDVHTLPFLFEISFKWIVGFTLAPVIIIILATMFAQLDKEDKIKKKHFKKSLLIFSGLFVWKLTTSYYLR